MDDDDFPFASAIIPAAGDSSRLSGARRKPWLPLGGEMLVARVVRLLKAVPAVAEIILAVHPDDENFARDEIGESLRQTGVDLIVVGGKTRAETVLNALQATDANHEVVAIHDAARPFADRGMCNALCKMARQGGAAIPVVPVCDSIKRVSADRVVENVRRLGLMAAQTPQCFKREILIDAYAYAAATGGIGEHITDDAGLVENYGREVRVILGSANNFKITTKEDWRRAELLVKESSELKVES
ncbi:2-C-methyl-D-erythritol 4-phosphate cytidylyltransferase [Planctomycetales bacterium]|nr:2-C-methyl-D-erythritol 4-phosphate cytidylyltransferase [Planctomycetales bacterium]